MKRSPKFSKPLFIAALLIAVIALDAVALYFSFDHFGTAKSDSAFLIAVDLVGRLVESDYSDQLSHL